MCFFVRGDSIVEKEFVFCYCLFAVSIFGGSTAFGHHISLNCGSVYTPAVYYVKNTSVMVVLSKTVESSSQQSEKRRFRLRVFFKSISQ